MVNPGPLPPTAGWTAWRDHGSREARGRVQPAGRLLGQPAREFARLEHRHGCVDTRVQQTTPPPALPCPCATGYGLRGGPAMSADNLPLQLTSFIGREREIDEVKHLLTTTRLLTLTGAGGCGKTRRALQDWTADQGPPPVGVWFGEPAGLEDPALVPQAVAAAVGAREVPGSTVTDSLVGYLGA